MEQNTDRMGFALIALSIVAVVLIIMNTIFLPTIKSYFQGLQKWSDTVMNQLNPPQQYTHTAYAYSADGKTDFSTSMPNFNLLSGTKDFSGWWGNVNGWTDDGTYKGLTVKKRMGQWGGIFKPITMQKDGVYTFSAYIKASGDNANIYRYVDLWDINGEQKWVGDFQNVFMGNHFDWKRDSFTVNLKKGDTLHPRYEIAGSGTLWTAGYKWESGKTVTPYMPSQSEATSSDGPTYIGTYTDTNEQGSQDPTKYTWKAAS